MFCGTPPPSNLHENCLWVRGAQFRQLPWVSNRRFTVKRGGKRLTLSSIKWRRSIFQTWPIMARAQRSMITRNQERRMAGYGQIVVKPLIATIIPMGSKTTLSSDQIHSRASHGFYGANHANEEPLQWSDSHFTMHPRCYGRRGTRANWESRVAGPPSSFHTLSCVSLTDKRSCKMERSNVHSLPPNAPITMRAGHCARHSARKGKFWNGQGSLA